MRGARKLARQACSLLTARRPDSSAWSPSSTLTGMQRLLHTNGPFQPPYAQKTTLANHSACLRGPTIPGCLAAAGLSQHRQQDGTPQVQTLGSRIHWRQAHVERFPVAPSASFTFSAPSHSVSDDDGPEGELHAVDTAIRANALIFAAKLGVFFISNSR